MIKEFKELNEDEIDLLYKVPAYISIYVAGCDGQIEKVEKKIAADIIAYKTTTANPSLLEYYHYLNGIFKEQFEELIDSLPEKLEDRNKLIMEELKKVNPTLHKIDSDFAHQFSKTNLELASYVAEASGGILGYLSISKAEEKALNELAEVFN